MGILSKALCFTRAKLQGYFKFIKQMETTVYTAEFIWLIFGETWNFCVNNTEEGQSETGGSLCNDIGSTNGVSRLFLFAENWARDDEPSIQS